MLVALSVPSGQRGRRSEASPYHNAVLFSRDADIPRIISGNPGKSEHIVQPSLPPRPPLPPLPPLWLSEPAPFVRLPPNPSPAPIVSAAVANLFERSICVRMVFAKYETTRTS